MGAVCTSKHISMYLKRTPPTFSNNWVDNWKSVGPISLEMAHGAELGLSLSLHFYFEARSCCTDHADLNPWCSLNGLKLTVSLLPQPSQCLDYWCVPPHLIWVSHYCVRILLHLRSRPKLLPDIPGKCLGGDSGVTFAIVAWDFKVGLSLCLCLFSSRYLLRSSYNLGWP